MLSDIKTLCYAFGQERTNNFLLPLIISWFNEKDSELKCIFFQNFVGISTIAGTESVTSFVLTCVIPELHDTNNYVVLSALDCLTALSRLSILKTKTLLEIVEYGSPHLLNPNTAIKCTTMALMDVISKNISFTDLHCFMIPLIRPYLTRDVVDISLEALTNCLLEPIGSWSLKKAVSVVFDEVKPTTTPISLVDFQPETRISFTTQQALKQVGSIPTNPGNSHICKLQSNGFSVATEVVRIESSKRNFNGKENEELSDIRYGLKIAELDVSKEDEEKLFLIRNFIKQCSRTYHNKTTSEEADRSKKDVGWSKEELGGLKTKNVNEVDPSMLGLLTDLNLLALPPAKTPKASLRTVPTVTSPPPRGLPPITPTGTIKPRRTSEATKSKMYTPVRAVTESEDVLGSITSSFGSLIRRPANASLKSWKPAGTLVAHLSEHSGAVTCIEPSKDNLFFASGGEDGTVKIWDCQRSICTKSKCSYFSNLANDPVRALTICENTHTVACAFQSGSIHLFRIEHVLEKKDYTYDIIGRTPITEFNVNKEEGEIVDLKHYNNTQDMGPCCAPGGSLLVYVTQQGYIHGKDLRTSKEAWKLKNSNNFGLISCVHMDPSRYWMVVGTMTGYVCGWDLRFRLPFAEWKTESKYIYKICSSPVIKGTQYGLLVTGPGYFHSLDLETGQVRWLFEKKNTSENERKPSSNQRRGSNAQKELLDFTHQESSTRALLSLPDSTAVISAGTEQTITYWDFEQPDSSCIISGRQNRTAPKYSFYPRRGVMVFEEDSPKDPPQFGSSQEAAVVTTIPTKHHDTITELKYLDQPTLALISASRDGVIKVWQ
uniref:non-specific serine/threonine protein kinase n=1 Tax=Arcella intermedia TaxID=1963864 RepID=A0A6B2KY74_9EUKA